MSSRFRRFTAFLLVLASALLAVLFAHTVHANDNNPNPENRVGQMSEAVIQSRLQQLGYAKPSVVKVQNIDLQRIQSNGRLVPATQYELDTIKDGRLVHLKVDRLSGKIEEIPPNNR